MTVNWSISYNPTVINLTEACRSYCTATIKKAAIKEAMAINYYFITMFIVLTTLEVVLYKIISTRLARRYLAPETISAVRRFYDAHYVDMLLIRFVVCAVWLGYLLGI